MVIKTVIPANISTHFLSINSESQIEKVSKNTTYLSVV